MKNWDEGRKGIEFFVSDFEHRKKADLLVLPFWKGKKQAEPAGSFGKLKAAVSEALETGDFTGKDGEVIIVYGSGQSEPRVALLGLGTQEKISVEKLRRAYATLVKSCRARKIKEINVVAPKIASLPAEGIVRGITEGLMLANYTFDKLKRNSVKEDPSVLLETATLIGVEKANLPIAKKYAEIAKGVYLARDLVNGNADDVTPQYLAQVAKDLAKKYSGVKTTVFDKKRIEKEKMGLLLAVNRGSPIEPAFIIIEYKGNPKSKDLTVLVGKGITYDTGGLSLKPVASMATMKCDMGGAATVLGTLSAVAALGMKVNITGVIPASENTIDGKSYKPGDVYLSYAGKSIEIMDTDAEGRLVLADALAYAAKHLKPTRIIDFATLTGAVDIALGAETTGMLSNQDALADAMMRAGYETYERLWRLPLFEEYRDQLRSEIADMKNTGGRSGGTITSSMFLKEFVDDIPWAHCDIASTAYLSEARRYHPKYGTGIGVRLMVDFLENL